MKTHIRHHQGIPMHALAVLMLGVLTAAPTFARQADREGGRYVGSRSVASAVIEWRSDRVVDSRTGTATVYEPADHRRRTSSGERFDRLAMTAAHSSYPFDSMVRVTNPDTGRRIVVRVNDRLDAGENSVIRLSNSAAERLGIGSAPGRPGGTVRIELLSSETVPAVMTGSTESEDDVRLTGAARVDEHPAQKRPDAERQASASHVRQDIRTTSGRDPVPSDSDDSYTLQIGSFSTLGAARRLAADVEGAWVMQVLEDGERVYRVYFGQFDTEQQARAAQDRLEKKGRDSFLRTIPS